MDGQNYVSEIAFSQPVINIGADPGNDVVLRGKGVASFHAMLNYSSDQWFFLPLDPSAHSLVNDRGFGSDGTFVRNGDTLTIGEFKLTLSLNGVNSDIVVTQTASSGYSGEGSSEKNDSAGANILLSLGNYSPVEIEAGTYTEFDVSVTNAGPLVANMQLQVQGIPSAWVQVIPPVLNLNEGRTGTFNVRVSPPRSSAAEAGVYQLHFVAISPNYPRETGTADAVLTVLPYSEFLVNGPTPRRLELSRRKPSGSAEFSIINNSNAASTFVVRAYDDANELGFTYRSGANSITQGQEIITVGPGSNEKIPIQVEAKKRPLFGLISHTHHYYTTVAPSDRPGDAQSLVGEAVVRPQIHIIWLLIMILLLAILAAFLFQPYVHSFQGVSGKHTEVIQAGNSALLSWDVSRFAGKITLSDGQTSTEVERIGSEYVTPKTSVTYTLTAENIISKLIGFTFEKEVNVLLIPKLPTIDLLRTDQTTLYYNQPVKVSWAVSSNAESAALAMNKQSKNLPNEEFSGEQSTAFSSDTLISLRAANDSGYELKSLFLNVRPESLTLNHFIAWVRPNGIAVPADNDVRRTTRWGSLQAWYGTNSAGTTRANPQPDAQSNTITIPDVYGTESGSGMNPEQQMVSSVVNSPDADVQIRGGSMDPNALLVSPAATMVPTAVPTAAAPVVDLSSRTTVAASAPASSPEGGTANSEFSIKLAEVIEDPMSNSGYRVIQYFPDYVLQKGEQVLLQWSVDGVSKVRIDNLSTDDLNAVDSAFIYPEKSTNYVLNAEVGSLKKSFSLPINVAGDSDDGEGSGLQCDLKANATTLTVPGTVMLTWTGGGNNRVQLLSSAKAEAEKSEADKKAEKEAKQKGEKYTPAENAPMSGGIIADYLQPAGFMRVNVDKQTTFVLNAYDGNGNVICTKNVEVKYTGGNDKLDLKFAITKVTNMKDEVVPVFYVGQTAQFTVSFSEFEAGKEPTGSVLITDGDSTCTLTLPKNSCSMVMKHIGTRKITALYSGDDTYNKKTATTSVRVRDRRNLQLVIKKITDEKDVSQESYVVGQNVKYTVQLSKFVKDTPPTGTIKISDGTSTCTLTWPDAVCTMAPKIPGTLKITAEYSGDEVYNPDTDQAEIEVLAKRDITFEITSITDENNVSQDEYIVGKNVIVTVALSDYEEGLDPTGTFLVSDGSSSCTMTYPVMSCSLAPKKTGDLTVTAIYSGDGNYASKKDEDAITVVDKLDLDFEITQITDEKGISQEEYVLDQTIQITVALTNYRDGLDPTGTVTITDGVSSCSLTLPVTVCTITAKKIGELTVSANYSGDTNYAAAADTETIIVADKRDLTLNITRIADVNGTETDEFTEGDEVYVTTELSDWVAVHKPSGVVTVYLKPRDAAAPSATATPDVSGSYPSCTVKYPDPADTTCSIVAEKAGEYDVVAVYTDDLYYNRAEDTERITVKVEDKLGIDLKIIKITDGEGNEAYNFIKGDTIQIITELSGYQVNEDPDPTGTITVTDGTSICELKCPQTTCLFEAKTVGDLTVKAIYSGDSNYKSAKAEDYISVDAFKKKDITLTITKITNEQGKAMTEFIKGQNVQVTAELSGYGDADPDPTGTITISDGTSSCTLTLPDQKTCLFEAKTIGDDLPLIARYSGDTNYTMTKTEESITVVESKHLTFEITKITDDLGVEQDEFIVNKNAKVTVALTDYVEELPPTGSVIVRVEDSDSTCTITLPQTTCSLPLKEIGTRKIIATYGGDNHYYAEEDSEEVEVTGKKELDVVFDKIVNEYGISQPYYVYDPKAGSGQLVEIHVSLSGADPNLAPTGTITITDGYNSCPAPLDVTGFLHCSFNVSSQTGDLPLTATYSGDDNYALHKTATTLYVRNRSETQVVQQPAYRRLSDRLYLETQTELHYDEELVTQFGVSPYEDGTTGTAETAMFEYTMSDVAPDYNEDPDAWTAYEETCTLDPVSRSLSCGGNVSIDSGTYDGSIQDVFTISEMFCHSVGIDRIKAAYEGNTYFYPADDTNDVMDESKGFTELEITEIFKVGSRAFLTARLKYDTDVTDKYGAVPDDKLYINAIGSSGTEEHFLYDLSTQALSSGTGLEITQSEPESGVIEFVIKYIWLGDNLDIDKVWLGYSKDIDDPDQYFMDAETEAKPAVENAPVVSIRNAALADSISVSSIFEYTEIGPLTEKYGVFDLIRFDLWKEGYISDDDTPYFCRMDRETHDFLDECHAGRVTEKDVENKKQFVIDMLERHDANPAKRLKVSFSKDLTGLQINYLPAAEWPSDDVIITGIPTTLKLEDVITVPGRHTFMTATLTYKKEFADLYSLPGIIGRIEFTMAPGTSESCSFSIPGTADCGSTADVEMDESTPGEIVFTVRNMSAQVMNSNAQASFTSNIYFGNSSALETITAEEITVNVDHAVKTSQYTAALAITTNYPGSIAQTKYNVYPEFYLSNENDSQYGPSCIFDLLTGTFPSDSGCTGNAEMEIVDSGSHLYSYKITDMQHIFGIQNEKQMHAFLMNDSNWPTADYPSSVKKYETIATQLAISDALRIDNSKAFVTVELEYDRSDPLIDLFSLEPGGTLTFIAVDYSLSSTKTCSYTMPSGPLSCDEASVDKADTSSGMRFVLKNMSISNSYVIAEVSYTGDSVFTKPGNKSMYYAAPNLSIDITSARKKGLTSLRAEFTVTNYSEAIDRYGLYDELVLYMSYSQPSYGVEDVDRSGRISWSQVRGLDDDVTVAIELPPSTMKGNLTKQGNTIIIDDLGINVTDFYVWIGLESGSFPSINISDYRFISLFGSSAASPVSLSVTIEP